jgi:hypothetical protein
MKFDRKKKSEDSCLISSVRNLLWFCDVSAINNV